MSEQSGAQAMQASALHQAMRWGVRSLEHVEAHSSQEFGGLKGLRFNSFAAKRARGMMARYMCEHRLENPEALKQFDSDGYQFDAGESTDDVWLFTRTLPTAA